MDSELYLKAKRNSRKEAIIGGLLGAAALGTYARGSGNGMVPLAALTGGLAGYKVAGLVGTGVRYRNYKKNNHNVTKK